MLLAQDGYEMNILDTVYTDGHRQHMEYVGGRAAGSSKAAFFVSTDMVHA